MKGPIIIVAGGTGGHVFPALSLAQELSSCGHQILLFTDPRGAKLINPGLYPSISIKTLPLRPRSRLITFYLSLMMCFIKGLGEVLKHRPIGIVGFGGYPTFTWGVIAGLCRIPLVLHEQNAVLGRTNRLLARWARSITLTFKPTLYAQSGVLSGVPVRDEFQVQDYSLPLKHEPFRLLVLGGSQGAAIFSTLIPQAVHLLPVFCQRKLEVIHQCPSNDLPKLEAAYERLELKTFFLAPFFYNVAELIKSAHLIIARAGASTIAEITTIGRPAIFIPFPYAKDDHQTVNAKNVANKEGGWFFPQEEFSGERLALFLKNILTSPALLHLMAEGAQQQGHKGATQKLSKLVLECFMH
jgi:UDP-N-acetylglucosamine--N-acetylmuramyl-(pentapeptide) pyrophosphoryl-undecaprenol N-acetylglucosamine transferase